MGRAKESGRWRNEAHSRGNRTAQASRCVRSVLAYPVSDCFGLPSHLARAVGESKLIDESIVVGHAVLVTHSEWLLHHAGRVVVNGAPYIYERETA